MSKRDRQIEGQLSERPLAELIREIIDTDLSGALRLSKGPAKVVIYFEKGELLFATSNLKAHRLRNVLQRRSSAGLEQFAAELSDEDLAAALLKQQLITADDLKEARAAQASDVLRVALLWTDGDWSYDRRVRVDAEQRVAVDADRLLLESARHIPLEFIKTRVGINATSYSLIKVDGGPLSPIETMTLSRVTQAGRDVTFADLATKSLRPEESLRGLFALCAAGLLRATDQRPVLSDALPAPVKSTATRPAAPLPPSGDVDVEALFKRMASASSHYEVLAVPLAANDIEIKNAYHELARRFHPDRFHQSELRAQVESAFARIGRAYETLIDETRRRDYDHSLSARPTTNAAKPSPEPPGKKESPVAAPISQKQSPAERAEASFQLGIAALERNSNDDAVRYLAEAATLEPRVARYRAHYGSALMRKPSLRRAAETELQAALKIEPNNASFRVMLAELYQLVGLRKRAETEAARALSADPTNKPARALLATLTSK